MLRCSIILILLFTSTNSIAQDAISVLLKYIEITGGEMQWNELKTCKISGLSWYEDLESLDSIENQKEYIIYRKWPDEQRIDFYKDSILSESSVYSNGRGVINFQQFSIELNTLVYLNFYPQKFLEILNSKKYSISSVTKTIINNKEYSLIHISNNHEDAYYYFNNENILEYERSSLSPNVLTKVSDYQKVDKYLIPFRTSKSRDGKLFFSEALFELSINPLLPDNIFSFR